MGTRTFLPTALALVGPLLWLGCVRPSESSERSSAADWQPSDGEQASAGAAGPPPRGAALASEGHELEAVEELPDLENVRERESVVDLAQVPPDVLAEIQSALIPKAIVGKDDRVPVSDTTVKPYSSVVRLFTRFVKGGGTWGCSGTLIAPHAVLTAAHCIYDSVEAPEKGYAYSVTVVPGLYLKAPRPSSGTIYNAPFGVGYGRKLFVGPRYPETEADPWGRIPHDYAVIRLKEPLPSAGVRGFGARAEILNQPTVMLAYHGDLSGALQMHESRDRVRKVLANGSFNHYMDEAKRSSGAGIVVRNTDSVFGVHSSSIGGTNPYNIAATITVDKQRLIAGWIK